jgi:hypothetical protein
MQTPDALSRRAVLAAGGVAALAAVASAAPVEAATYQNAQLGWRFCSKCRGLVYSPKGGGVGTCPAGGKHQPSKTVDYVLYEEGTLPNWRRCTKCAGLFGGDVALGVCPKGGQHAGDTRIFELWLGPGITGVTDDFWDGCDKCKGLFNWGSGAAGTCPAGGGHVRLEFFIKLVMLY